MNRLHDILSHLHWSTFAALVPKITFVWPLFLWGLLFVPLAALTYFLLLRRRKKGAYGYGALALVRRATQVSGWRRHVPPMLMLGALALLILGIARPAAEVSLPSNRATVILAMDVSGSMRAADVNPSRIAAAQAAAKAYIKDQPRDVAIGIVAFAATALLVQNPTTDRTLLNAAIDRFELQRGTAVGSGILVALSSLFPQDRFPVNNFGATSSYGSYDRSAYYGGWRLGAYGRGGDPKKHVPVEPGSYKNAVVILLTDGSSNTGYDPVEAAKFASDYGVKVYTVGFGTTRGSVVRFAGYNMRAELDEDSLKKVADMTRGRYFHAASADDLAAVYQVLSKQLIMETKEMEITSFFAAAAAFLMLLSAGLSVAWFGRIL